MTHRILFIIAATLFASSGVSAQDVARSVLASGGGHTAGSEIQLSWTLGECITETATTDNMILTQGFQQSDIQVKRITPPALPNAKFNASVYPNPTAHSINIAPSSDSNVRYDAQVFDMQGKLITQRSAQSFDGLQAVDMSSFPSGTYTLAIRTQNDSTLAFQIIKIQ